MAVVTPSGCADWRRRSSNEASTLFEARRWVGLPNSVWCVLIRYGVLSAIWEWVTDSISYPWLPIAVHRYEIRIQLLGYCIFHELLRAPVNNRKGLIRTIVESPGPLGDLVCMNKNSELVWDLSRLAYWLILELKMEKKSETVSILSILLLVVFDG